MANLIPTGRLRIWSFVVGMVDTNCYLVADADSRDTLIVDPGDDPHFIVEAVRFENLAVRAIVNTHGHADHIAANRPLSREFACPIMIHKLDAPYLDDPELNLSAFIGYSEPLSPPADHLLKDGDEVELGSHRFRVIHTPGHTPGGICLLSDGVLFSGDTLFAGGIGRADFPGGSHEQLVESIRTRLLVLPSDTVVYPGHGPETTIDRERRENPWL